MESRIGIEHSKSENASLSFYKLIYILRCITFLPLKKFLDVKKNLKILQQKSELAFYFKNIVREIIMFFDRKSLNE